METFLDIPIGLGAQGRIRKYCTFLFFFFFYVSQKAMQKMEIFFE